MSTSPAETYSDEERAGDWRRLRVFVAALIALVVVIGGWAYLSGQPERDAIAACQTVILGKLKTPATAEFTGVGASETQGAFYVSGNVDAQNSFGALIRSHFSCEVKSGKVTDSVLV